MKENPFINRQIKIIGEEQSRRYAVLFPVVNTNEGSFVLFEKRSHKLNNGPGEISLPGGKAENDESFKNCAIRETAEELRIEKNQINIIGPGDIFVSPFNMIIYPYLGSLTDYHDTFSTDEVSEIIKIPLAFFKQHQPLTFKNKVIQTPPEDFPYENIPNGKNYPWASGYYEILFYKYDHHIIWGITARIVQSIIRLITEYHLFNS